MTGDKDDLDLLVAASRQGAFGAHVVQQQRYSETSVAVNLTADSEFDISGLFDQAESLNVNVNVRFIVLSI